eukprot:CAMPEP_0195130536 /NCGR_PEP_ID=MMETSP0448-20130528/143427_1 /TAXON_ID=66468 /ORGANISM="Heterocapsa triquestra, Strain CCMP 448" /LENGTH=119 /DNA_ID=CAMNT_0040168453 /DNA_START=389 /DNA_END=744 /DNA_ORIENTATION=+
MSSVMATPHRTSGQKSTEAAGLAALKILCQTGGCSACHRQKQWAIAIRAIDGPHPANTGDSLTAPMSTRSSRDQGSCARRTSTCRVGTMTHTSTMQAPATAAVPRLVGLATPGARLATA